MFGDKSNNGLFSGQTKVTQKEVEEK